MVVKMGQKWRTARHQRRKDKQQDKRIRKIEKMLRDEKKMCDILVPSQTLQQPNTLGVGVYAFHITNLIQKGDNVYLPRS